MRRTSSQSWWPLVLLLVVSCAPEGADRATGGSPPDADPTPVPGFREITAEVLPGSAGGTWPAGSLLAPEIMGPGVGLLDFDRDGDLDLLQLVMPAPGSRSGGARRLYRQEADGTFAPVDGAAGLADNGYAQAVAVGDVNGDGWPDVYFANWGRDRLFVNRKGRFEDVTGGAGIDGSGWSSGAAFCDADGDGDQDLFVARYLDYDPDVECIGAAGIPDYCAPQSFPGLPDRLFVNDGRGGFVDRSEALGVRYPDGGRRAKGLAVLCTDLSGDGRADFYVANDREANNLWVRQEDGTYVDEAVVRGAAVNRYGRPEASMGLDVGDVDGDGALDLVMTHLGGENNTYYRRDAGGLFDDRTSAAGMAAADRPWTGFGCGLFDYDHDGDADFAVVNGRVRHGTPLPGTDGGFWSRYGEPNLFFVNDGAGRFEDVSPRIGDYGRPIEVSRGLALGDLDRDGDLDMVLSNGDGTVRIYRNDAPPPGTHWLQVVALENGTPALGAQVALHDGDWSSIGALLATASYESSREPIVHFGLGARLAVEAAEVVWPDGVREWFEVGAVDRRVELRRGDGGSAR